MRLFKICNDGALLEVCVNDASVVPWTTPALLMWRVDELKRKKPVMGEEAIKQFHSIRKVSGSWLSYFCEAGSSGYVVKEESLTQFQTSTKAMRHAIDMAVKTLPNNAYVLLPDDLRLSNVGGIEVHEITHR